MSSTEDLANLWRHRPPAASYQPHETSRAGRGRAQHRDLSGLETPTPAFSSAERPSSSATNAGGGRVTSRIMHSVRRSLSYGAAGKKRDAGLAEVGMQSTPEETLPPTRLHVFTRGAPYRSHNDSEDRGASSPTIEQIAMGLHISRTPHLGPGRGFGFSHTRSHHRDTPDGHRSVSPASKARPTHHRRESAPVFVPNPIPGRSSLKKPSSPPLVSPLSVPPTPSDSNVSLSTMTTSTTPSTPRSTRSASATMAQFSTRLHLRMSKLLLPSRRNSTASAGSGMTGTMSSDDDSTTSDLTPRKVVRFSSLTEAGEDPIR